MFKTQPIVIPNLHALDIPQNEAGRVFSSSKFGEVEPECNFVGNLAKDTSDEVSHDCFPESETAEQTIGQKFLAADVNIQSSLTREKVLARRAFVETPRLANESDKMFENVPNTGVATNDKELRKLNQSTSQIVADFLTGCASTSNRDSGFPVSNRFSARSWSLCSGTCGCLWRHPGT